LHIYRAHSRIGFARLEKQTSSTETNGDYAMTIRNLIAALGLLSLSSAGAMAADLALKAPPPAAPAPTWTGFYIGVNGGASWATAANAINLAGLGAAGTLPLYSQGLNGFLGGGQIGYNYQTGNFLVGVEGDGDWSNIKGTTPCLVEFSCSANMKWTADATVRAGVLPIHNLLVYVKGGASWTDVNYNFSSGSLLGAATLTSNASETKVGGLLGFGTEYMFAPHWTAKIEYNYVDYGSHTDNHTLTLAVPGAAVNVAVPVQSSLKASTMKAGINYLF
jgi:outer membrane immunogenic protein